MPSTYLGDWTYEQIHSECSDAYKTYRAERDTHYASYFAGHPELASEHPLKAKDLESALPPGMDHLAAHLPVHVRHRHHLSGRSSQVLGVALLGAALATGPDLGWFEQFLSPIPPFRVGRLPAATFERELDADVLNESPRVTAVDFYVETEDVVICTEVKWGEDGLGRCSCGPGNAAQGTCARRVLDRTAYWGVAKEFFLLPDRIVGKPCPISAGYQAIRNAAAATALAAARRPVFVLLYDARNPYFRQTNSWPGWPAVLTATLAPADRNNLLNFRAIAWQELIPALPLKDEVRAWAAEKHLL